MYSNFESTASYPSLGRNYVKMPAVSGSFNETYDRITGNAEILPSFDSIPTVYKLSSHGEDVLISGSFNATPSESMGNPDSIWQYWQSGSGGDDLYFSESMLYVAGDDSLYQQSSSFDTGSVHHFGLNQFHDSQSYEVVFDVNAKGFRVFNWNTAQGQVSQSNGSYSFDNTK